MKSSVSFLFFMIVLTAGSVGQSTPQELSKTFTNSLLNYNEEKLRVLLPDGSVTEQTEMLAKLKTISSIDLKPLKGAKLSSSTRAVLKDGDKTFKERADIFITITDNKELKYELKLWGCGKINDKWKLGNKVEAEKVAVF